MFAWILLGLAVAVAALNVGRRAYRFQPGTYERYRLLSIRRGLSFIVIGCSLGVAVFAAIVGDVFTMAAQTFVGCMWLWSDKLHRNDDDFFNRFRDRTRQRRQVRRAAQVSAR